MINHSTLFTLVDTCQHLCQSFATVVQMLGHLLTGFHTYWKPSLLPSIISQTPGGVCNLIVNFSKPLSKPITVLSLVLLQCLALGLGMGTFLHSEYLTISSLIHSLATKNHKLLQCWAMTCPVLTKKLILPFCPTSCHLYRHKHCRDCL